MEPPHNPGGYDRSSPTMDRTPPEPGPPRILRVDLAAPGNGAAAVGAWSDADPALDRVGRAAGSAVGLAVLLAAERARPGGDPPFVVSVGRCVGRGLPTAARATVASRAPLTGLFAEGHVGGGFGRRLARVCDALVLAGRTDLPGAVLVVGADGGVRLDAHPELAGADPVAVQRGLEAEHGPCATLRVGAAGESGVRFASLAGGGHEPSFVGRGGLGHAFGSRGLKAVCVTAPEVPPAGAEGHEELLAALAASPRLVARGEGGTYELLDAYAARGEVGREAGARLLGEVRAAGAERRGCRGCPTPCGWVFERGGDGGRQHARFSATHALGPALGLSSFDDSLALLAACDRIGVDAKEIGAALALYCREREPSALGDRARLEAWIEDLVARQAEGALFAQGAAALARELGCEDELPAARGEAAALEGGLAAVLGQCVSSNGADPMRTFPFLMEAGGRARMEALLGDVSLPPGAEDPGGPAGKGRLVWWHENLIAAVDVTGFCAFSAAGLLADGLCDVDGLASWILAEGGDLLALGAEVVAFRRELNRCWGAPEETERPAWARDALDQPGMLDEYLAWREGARTVPEPIRRAPPQRLGGPNASGLRNATAPRDVSEGAGGLAPAPYAHPVRLRRLGRDEVEVALDEACPLHEVLDLADLAAEMPSVYRDGKRLAADDLVHPGDALDLVVAIAGG